MLNLTLCFLTQPASAQDVTSTATPERPILPSVSLAGDDGPFTLWSNPASMAFDPDAGAALLYSQNISEVATPSHLALATQGGGFGMGFAFTGGADQPEWWTLSTGLGLRLDRNLTVGVHLGWQLPEGERNNFSTLDLSLGYRPTPWIGFAGVAQNIGAPSIVDERYGGGTVLRPFGDVLSLGGEYLVTRVPGDTDEAKLRATLKVQPIPGLVLRGSGDDAGNLAGGLELVVGRTGYGAHAAIADDTFDPFGSAYLVSGMSEGSIASGRSVVPHYEVDKAFPYQPAVGLFSGRSESYLHLLSRLHAAARDRSVPGVFIELDAVNFSFAQIQELSRSMADLRARGKTVVVYLNHASSNGAYLLASGADKIYVHPAGGVDLIGLSAEMQFFRGALDLVGVEPQVIRRAEYKSAFESFTNTESSEASRESTNALLDDLFGNMVTAIAEGRAKDETDIRNLIDAGPYTAKEATENGLVDGSFYPDQIREQLDQDIGRSFQMDDEYRLDDDVHGWRAQREIAVIFVTGAITSGPSGGGGFFGGGSTAGSETITKQLRAARRAPSIKGVILRVDSPGGSAFASDEIGREVDLLIEAGKPVVVSMGGVAASGGYWVSATATAIFAEPTTITGSIGVITAKMSLGALFEKVNINTELFNRGRNAALYTSSRPWDEIEYAALDRMIDDTYNEFLTRVSVGRDMTMEEAGEVARGRVWSGKAAKELGLVDELGGFYDALERVRDEAGIPERADVELVTLQTRRGSEQVVVESGAALIRQALLPQQPTIELPPELEMLRLYPLLRDEHVLAMAPYHLEIH